MGVLLAALFPGSYQFLKVAHLSHHKKNRSDSELVDYVRPGESALAKRVQFYALVCGLVWIGVPLLTVVIAAVPWELFTRRARAATPTGGASMYLAFLREVSPWRVRAEMAIAVAIWWGLFRGLHLTWPAVGVCYAAFAFSWSSQQYIYHVRSARHLVEGAFNLRLWRPLELLYLQFNYHLTHHRAVSVPWIHLRRATELAPTQGYLATYLRLWAPPQPIAEAWPVAFQVNGKLPSRPRAR
jgi:fatty acid desaturase